MGTSPQRCLVPEDPRTRTMLLLERLTALDSQSPTGALSRHWPPGGLTRLHSNHADKLPTALPAEAPGPWAVGIPVDSKFCRDPRDTCQQSQIQGLQAAKGASGDHSSHAGSWSCRAGASANPNCRQPSIHSSEARLQAVGMAICHGGFSPACRPLPGTWPVQQQKTTKGESAAGLMGKRRGTWESCRVQPPIHLLLRDPHFCERLRMGQAGPQLRRGEPEKKGVLFLVP